MAQKQPDGTVHAHVAPLKSLVAVFLALVGLTVLTVTLANAGLGEWDFLVAMVIATIKMMLVALFFMHLKDDKTFNVLVIVTGVVFMLLFIGLTLLDIGIIKEGLRHYQGD